MEDKTIIIVDEEGNETLYDIILTFKSPETNKDYVIYKLPNEDEEVMAAEYKETADGEGSLTEIETDAEYEMIQEVLDSFMGEE